MTQQQAAVLSPETLIEEFKKNGVTHIVTIPDSETNYLYELMKEQPWLDVIPSAREGETFAIALGLIIGGQNPVVLISPRDNNPRVRQRRGCSVTAVEPTGWLLPVKELSTDRSP